MKVFFDTNVWLSATLFSGLCSELITRCEDENKILLTSALIREEALQVLTRKFPHRKDAANLFDASWIKAQLVADKIEPANDNDARLVAAAANAAADLFVTGDQRVLDWKTHGNMRVMSPREAWEFLFASH